MTAIVHFTFAVLALPAVLACIYLLGLTLLSAPLPMPAQSTRRLRFEIIVPAHNEAAVIERCLADLRTLDWPKECVRLLVIADHCTDDTAARARAAGAQVLERSEITPRRKGYVLAYGFEHSLKQNWADAMAVVDADTEVTSNLLEAFAARIEAGAGVVQAHYCVLNPVESWRTRLMAIAYGAFHTVRSRARERLNLSCGVRGTGWCVTRRVLSGPVPFRAFTLDEDLEYGITLGLGGERVHYAEEAQANAVMESAEPSARRQRQRWENGRFDLLRSQTLPLLRAAVTRPSAMCLDLALDLLVLPLSMVAINLALLIGAAALASLWQPGFHVWLWVGSLSAAALIVHVLRGWQLSGSGEAGIRALLYVPFYALWKMVAMLRGHDRGAWVPTPRKET